MLTTFLKVECIFLLFDVYHIRQSNFNTRFQLGWAAFFRMAPASLELLGEHCM